MHLHPHHSQAARVRQDILDIVADALCDWAHGCGPSFAEVRERIDLRIDSEINEAVTDALREQNPD